MHRIGVCELDRNNVITEPTTVIAPPDRTAVPSKNFDQLESEYLVKQSIYN